MKTDKLFLLLLCTLMLSSCCFESDSRVAKGYPYGDEQELNFTYSTVRMPASLQTIGQWMSINHVKYFSNKDTCEKILKFFDSTCNCDGIDFDNYALIPVVGNIYKADEGIIEPRVLINHISKEYTIELRGYKKDCRNKYDHFEFNEWLVIPKPPVGYSFNRKNLLPGP